MERRPAWRTSPTKRWRFHICHPWNECGRYGYIWRFNIGTPWGFLIIGGPGGSLQKYDRATKTYSMTEWTHFSWRSNDQK